LDPQEVVAMLQDSLTNFATEMGLTDEEISGLR